MTGTVRWYHAEKGCGLVDPDGGGAAVFVASGDLAPSVETLFGGQRVHYAVRPDGRLEGGAGLAAVTPLD